MAKGKVLSTVISLAGKVDGSLLKAVNKSKSQTVAAAKVMSQSMTNSTKAMSKAMAASTQAAGKAMNKSFRSMAAGALKVYGVIKAIGRLKDFATETMTAAKAQLDVQTKLSAVLENVKSIQIRGPNAAAAAAKELNKVADALETVGVIGNDVTVAGMQQLATYQLSDNEISVLSAGMDDLLAQQKGLNASQSDAVSIANMIGKAMTGSVGALSKVGITFTEAQAEAIKTGDATQRAATIAQVLQDNVGGVNKALAETDQGQLVQAQNTFDAIKEEIGYFLLPLLNRIVKGILPYASKGLEKLTAVLDKIGPKVNDIVDKGFSKLSDIMPVITQTISNILPIVAQLFSYFREQGNNILPFILSTIQMILPVIKALIPQLLSIASNIIPGIMAAVKNIIPFIIDLVNQLIPLAMSIINALIPAFEQIIPPVTKIIKGVFPVLISLLKLIVPFIVSMVRQIAPLVGILIDALIPAFQMLIPPIMNLVSSLLPPLKQLFTSVFSVIRSLAPVISVVAQVISAVLGAAIATFIPVAQNMISYIKNIIDTLNAIINFVVNVFTGNWGAAWENVKSIFSGIFTGFVDIAKMPLNQIITLVNSAINGINGLTGIINKIPGVNIGKIPQIPYLAKGATVTSPTLAMIGEGKVPETVVPHNNTARSRALLAEAAKGVGVGTGSTSYLPFVDKIVQSLSYFSDKYAGKSTNNASSSSMETVNNGGNIYKFYFSPEVYASDASGVQEVLEDEYEKFKSWVKQLRDEEGREVFG